MAKNLTDIIEELIVGDLSWIKSEQPSPEDEERLWRILTGQEPVPKAGDEA